MTAGLLRHRIQVQMREPTLSASTREQSKTYVPVPFLKDGGAWARWMPLRGADYFGAQENRSTLVGKFRIRYRLDLEKQVTGQMRVKFLGKFYDIVGEPVDFEGRHEWLDLNVSMGTKSGRPLNV